MPTSRPSIAELRAATQPPQIFERNSGEHWAGRLYIRAGVAAAGLLSVDGLLPAIGAVVLIQLQILLDCSDGEVARWRGQSSPRGIYLDRIGHYVTEAGLPIALGIRADEPTLGLIVAVLVLLIKSETALVHLARSESGKQPAEDRREVAAPRGGVLRAVRNAL